MAETTRKKTTRRKTPVKNVVATRSTAEARGRPQDQRPIVASAREISFSHRLRQASVAAILDQVFGPFGASDPKLWERRAYLLLVGSVYERLATDAELGTDELVKLARVLAESRRSKLSSASSAPPDDEASVDDSSAGGNGRPPKRMGVMVRDLYGTNVPDARTSAADQALRKEGGGVGG